MDSWRYMPGGKNMFLSEDLENLPVDGIASSQGASMEWETKPSYGVRSYPIPSNSGPIENSSGFMELGFSDKSYSNVPSRLVSSTDFIGIESCKRSSFPAFDTSNPVASGEGSSSRISNLYMESNRQESMMFDLKLGGFADSGFAKDSQFFREGSSKLSGSNPSPAKRGRSTSLNLQAPLCQVHGCNKDLSAFKDYYKRHKVCEAHTKTAKVIVNSIEQRFCQQCSRFHLLAEFDEGKRSCRKRLADHNERRRKPQLAAGSGSSFLESCILRGSSSSLQDMVPTDTLGCSEYENGKITGHINFEASTSSLKVVPEDVPSGIRERMFGMAACNGQDVRRTSRALSLLSDRTQDIPTHLLRSQSSDELMTKMDWDGRRADSKSRAPANRFMNDSGFMDNKDGHKHHHHHLLGGGTMVDMHQLSSHLQRVEEQRNAEQVRPPDHLFSTFHPSSEGE